LTEPLKCPFVFVRWLDASTAADAGWADEESDDCDVGFVWSSGWMLKRNKIEVKLVSDASEGEEGYNRRIAIPWRMVEEIRKDSIGGEIIYLRKAKRAKKVAAV
jgi:hypothetical protein